MVSRIEKRWAAFEELREVLRLSSAELPGGDTHCSQPDLPALEVLRLEQLKEALEQYATDLQARVPASDRNPARPSSTPGIILRYLRRYGDKLFGHPIRCDDEGRIVAVVDRTNNVVEHFFSHQKQRLRRRLGRAHLGRDLEQQPAQVALVANLRSPEYVRVLCGSIENLPSVFAVVDADPAAVDGGRISRGNPKTHLRRRVRALLNGKTPPSPQPTVAAIAAQSTPEALNNKKDTTKPKEKAAPRAASRRPRRKRNPFFKANGSAPRDPRLPPVGSILERWYNGRANRVHVLDDGFIWGSTHYESLTATAVAIAKTQRTGYQFFGLTMPWEKRAARIRGRRINQSTLIDLPNPTEF